MSEKKVKQLRKAAKVSAAYRFSGDKKAEKTIYKAFKKVI